MKIAKRIALFIASLSFVPLLALADQKPSDLPQNAGDVMLVIEKIGNWLFTGLIIMSTIMLIVAAYKYLFSQGSEEQTGAAKNTIVYAVVALIVAMLAKGVPYLVSSILSVK